MPLWIVPLFLIANRKRNKKSRPPVPADVSLKLKTRDGEITIPAGAGLLSKVSRGVVTWAEIRGLV